MSGCQRFTPNQWKPEVCSDCLRSRAAHSIASEHAVTGAPDLSACEGESDTASQYANMPLTDSSDKKRSSLKKKFNSLLRGSEKAPIPAPRKGFIEAPDISAPIPIQLDASGKFKSESSFDSVSSLEAEEIRSVGDELAVPVSDRPYEEVFYEGDLDRGQAAGNGPQALDEPSADDQPATADPPPLAVPSAEDTTSSPAPLPLTNGTARPVVEFNGYTELDLDEFDGPALTTSSTVPASGEESQPLGLPEDYQPRDPPEESQPLHPPEEYQPRDPPRESQPLHPPEESQPLDPPGEYQPTDPHDSQPVSPTKVKPPLKAKPKINVASQAANRRMPPSPPPPYSKKPSVTSEEMGRENGSDSPKGKMEPAAGSSPLSKEPPNVSPAIVPRPRRRSQTVGSGVTRRRPPPPPPVKEALDVHFPLSVPQVSRDEEDRTSDIPPSKPARSRARLAHTNSPSLSPAITTRSPPVRSTSPHSNSGSSLEPQHALHSPTHSPVPSPLANTATASAAIAKEPSPVFKRKNSLSSKMKHKFGFRSNAKAPPVVPSELAVAVDVEEQKKKDSEEQEVVEVEKKGKIKKLFRKRSKTFSSGQKKPARLVANSSSRDDSSFNFRDTNGSVSPSLRRTQSPETSRLNSPLTFHNTAAEMTEDHSHEYAECGEPLLSKHSTPAKEQETSGSHSSGGHLGTPACSASARPVDDSSSMCSEFIASLQPETIPVDPLIISVGQLQTLMAESVNNATKKVSSMYKRLYTPPSSIKCTWDDCTPVSDWPAVVIKDKTYAVLVMDEQQWEAEEAMSSCLPPHPHIVRQMAVMFDPPPFAISGLHAPQGSCVYVLTNAATNVCLKDFLLQQRSRLSQEKFERLVCLVLLQLFLAMHHLRRHGVVHRNITSKSILINPCNLHVQLSDYACALHKEGSFMYSVQEVNQLGGEDSCLPPEIASNSSTTRELDYSGIDVFEAGCLIYQLLGQEHPFESEPELIHTYGMSDLPPLPLFSPYSLHLQRIAHLLLKPDPQSRISAATALQIMSCLLWLPHAWITQPVPQTHVQNFLVYEKTRLMADLAEMWVKRSAHAPSLEELLKSSFFTLMSTNQILKSLKSYSHEISIL